MTTQEILEAARAAKSALALADEQTRKQALWGMADGLCHPDQMQAILAANAEDMAAARGHISDVMLDRLALTPERIGAMARGILEVAACPTRWAWCSSALSGPTVWSSKRPPCPWASSPLSTRAAPT